MIGFIFFALAFAAMFVLAIRREPLSMWALWAAAVAFIAQFGVFSGDFHGPDMSTLDLLAFIPAIVFGLLSLRPIRRAVVTRPAFKTVQRVLPPVSKTEQEALDAGTQGFDSELFSGRPSWSKLRAVNPIVLTDEEQRFLDNETEELCKKLNDWEIRHNRHGIPEDILKFIREKGFLGMLISKEHGGLGFSPQAQSMILGKVSSRNPDAAIVVMVPNSLGPGELIEQFGTDEQKKRYLEPLAKGKEIPCFALTSPVSGSDAAAMRDVGTVTMGTHEGKEVLGIKLNFDKRYITLAPKATIVGLAFHLFDPDNKLGRGQDIGITLALIPANHPGVDIGRRHLPAGSSFPNGPVRGENVFIPIDWVVGGKDRVGQGWRMLMACLAAGRAISLPAASTAGAKAMLRNTSAYARIRKQFSIPIGRMEGIIEPLAEIAETAYTLEAARAVTSSMVSQGAKPAVISGLMKYQATERMRKVAEPRARHPRRQGHLRRPPQLFAGRLSDFARQHHGRGREYSVAEPDCLRAGRFEKPSLSLFGDQGRSEPRQERGLRSVREGFRGACGLLGVERLSRVLPQCDGRHFRQVASERARAVLLRPA